jgi:hypothetical protein
MIGAGANIVMIRSSGGSRTPSDATDVPGGRCEHHHHDHADLPADPTGQTWAIIAGHHTVHGARPRNWSTHRSRRCTANLPDECAVFRNLDRVPSAPSCCRALRRCSPRAGRLELRRPVAIIIFAIVTTVIAMVAVSFARDRRSLGLDQMAGCTCRTQSHNRLRSDPTQPTTGGEQRSQRTSSGTKMPRGPRPRGRAASPYPVPLRSRDLILTARQHNPTEPCVVGMQPPGPANRCRTTQWQLLTPISVPPTVFRQRQQPPVNPTMSPPCDTINARVAVPASSSVTTSLARSATCHGTPLRAAAACADVVRQRSHSPGPAGDHLLAGEPLPEAHRRFPEPFRR